MNSVSTLVSLMMMLLSIALSVSAKASCNFQNEVQYLRLTPPSQNARIADFAKFQQTVSWGYQNLAKSTYQTYRAGDLQPTTLADCLKVEELKELDGHLTEVFFAQSVAELSRSSSQKVRDFVTRITAANQPLLMFKFVGHRQEELLNDKLPAGYHRGERSIFFNFNKIHPDDWLIIFIHEVSHGIDTKLQEAVRTYAKSEPVAQLAKTSRTNESLSDVERKMVREWLLAALDRGLLAEVRAWTETFDLYIEGRRENLWPEIPWIASVLTFKGAGEPMNQFVMRYLSPRFTDPNVFPFNASPVKEELQRIRAQLLR